MANLTVRRESGGEQRAQVVREWDPFRIMRSFFSRDPFGEMAQLLPEVERGITFMPAFEVKETKDAFVFRADMPGVKESDLDVTLTGNRLSIAGKRDSEKEDKTDTYYVYERSYGSFTRSFTLPAGIDGSHVAANLEKGVLTVTVAKKAEVQAKKIAVGGEKPKS